MSKVKEFCGKYLRVILFFVFLSAVIYFIVRNVGAFGNVLLVMIGFGAVVIVHEFGHFIIAKASNIKVEAFSIFMPPCSGPLHLPGRCLRSCLTFLEKPYVW